MPYRFDDQVIVITGAASGIGRATAVKLASLGATLALSDINIDGLEETYRLCVQGKHSTSDLDVGSSADVDNYINFVVKQHGEISHVFNCAGVNPTAYALTDTTDEYYDKLMNTNLRGTYNVTRAAIPHMRADPNATEHASFVNVSSKLGVSPARQMAIYAATKWAIIGFSKSMALDLGEKGIRVNVVAPGYIDTPTNAGVVAGAESVKRMEAKVAMGRLGTAEECADVVAFLMSQEARYVNGSVVEVNGGCQ